MYRLIAALALLLLSQAAAAFPIDLEVDAEGLDLEAVVHTDGLLAVVQVTNHEQAAIRCTARFFAGPDRGRTRRAIIEPGHSASLSWAPRRTVVRLRVELSCQMAR